MQQPTRRPEVGVLVMAYGTPRTPEEIEQYYTHIRHGRPPTPELLADLQRRYAVIGGTSPLLAHTDAQARGLQAALDQLSPGFYQVAVGLKHTAPFIEDGVAELEGLGVQRVVGLVLAPHYSALSVGEYAQRVRACHPAPAHFTMIEHWHLAPGYLHFLTREVRTLLDRWINEQGIQSEQIEVLFTAHSLPARILEIGDPYPTQLRETAEAVARLAHLPSWSIAWQSAGRTHDPWIGPDILEVLPDLAARGRRGVLVCAAGFVSDHLEVLYDLDQEAREAASRLGLFFARTPMPNADPGFLTTLAEVVHTHVNQVPVPG